MVNPCNELSFLAVTLANNHWVDVSIEAGQAPALLDFLYFDIGGYTSGQRIDDLIFSAGKLRRSYQVVPGAAIGGVLGSQTGPNVVAENGQTRRYFHYMYSYGNRLTLGLRSGVSLWGAEASVVSSP
jgi:hypothetical protein